MFSLLNRKAAVTCGFFLALWGFICIGPTHAQKGRWYPEDGAAPVLKLKTVDNQEIDLAALKGRMVIVNFWATWCGPCIAEMPSLQALGTRLGAKNAVILGVNYHESPQRISDFQAKHLVTFPLLRDPWQEASGAWQVRVLPTTFIVDASGALRYRVVGEVDWGSKDVADRLKKILAADAADKLVPSSRSAQSAGKFQSLKRIAD